MYKNNFPETPDKHCFIGRFRTHFSLLLLHFFLTTIMKKIIYSIFVLLLTFSALTAQQQWQQPCGTSAEKSDWLIRYQQHRHSFPRTLDTLYVPMTIHLLGDDSGAGYFPLRKVLDAVCTLNEDFAPSAIRFYIEGEINYVNRTEYYDHESFGPGYAMMQELNVANTINCYFVTNPAGNCGYSIYNLGVALGHNCVSADDHTWAHELGHAFSLPHTFSGWEGYDHAYNQPAPEDIDGHLVERTNGANCEEAGDGFCDTPADYLNFRWGCTGEGLSNTQQRDPDSIQFRSEGSFFMSYSADDCTSRFSDEQIAAMRANIVDERANFLYDQTPVYPVENFIGETSPANGETLLTATEAFLTWVPTPNATHYFIQVSPSPSFGSLVFGGVVVGTELLLNDLDPDRRYYWRMRPFNKVFACTDFAPTTNFRTALTTATTELETLVSQIKIQPNPAPLGTEINLTFSAYREDLLQISLVDLVGSTVWEIAYRAKAGINRLEINEPETIGIHVLTIQSISGNVASKLVARQLIVLD